MKFGKFFVSCLFGLLSTTVWSEILHDIRWVDSLGEVKSRYPNASFQKVKPAWLTPEQAFFVIKGDGLPGTLRVVFDDSRPFFKKKLLEGAGTLTPELESQYTSASNRHEDDALTVEWVRWSPVSPIPLSRYKQRYGMPKCSFTADSMEPMCAWPLLALEALMSDDEKFVLHVTTTFTKAEKRSAYFDKYQVVPDYLK